MSPATIIQTRKRRRAMAKELVRRESEQENLHRHNPMSVFDALHRQMDRLFEDFTRSWPGVEPLARLNGAFVPDVDVIETDDTIHVEAELAGMNDKDVEVTLSSDGQELTLRGEKRIEREQHGRNWHRAERVSGSFVRVIDLPCQVAQDKVDALFKNGVLSIDLQKTPEAKKKRTKIAIKRAD
jgi:HSP20 family protein